MKNQSATLLLALFLAGCAAPKPTPPVVALIKPKIRTQAPKISEESRRLAAFYTGLESRLLQQGMLRQDYAPPDAPFDINDLVRNFRKIALYDEYAPDSESLVAKQTVSSLRRWRKPIRLATYFGPSVTKKQKQSDVKEVHSFARRLSALSKIRFDFATLENANFVVFFLNRDELLDLPAKYAQRAPNLLTSEVVHGIETLPDEVECIVYGHTSAKPPFEYLGAVVVIRAEHTPLRRKSCVHEEMAQGMGLANDDPQVRPSIFNDDEEFALLTQHDETLLKMLYDPILKTGMTPDTEDYIFRQAAENATKQTRF